MEDEGIKSALEIAMERLSGMPELTPEDISEQREKEYRPIGEGLCHKYLQGLLAAVDLAPELNRHEGECGVVVRRSLITCLCRALRLEAPAAADRVIEGVLAIAPATRGLRHKIQTDWMSVFEDYKKGQAALLKEKSAAARERLSRLGIGGSAVTPAMDRDEEYTQALAGLQQSFEPRLEAVRARLRAATGA